MYSELETEQIYYITEKPYFEGKYYIKKAVVVTYLYSTHFKKLIRHESHFGELLTQQQKDNIEKEKEGEDYDDNYLYDYVICTNLRTYPPTREIVLLKDYDEYNARVNKEQSLTQEDINKIDDSEYVDYINRLEDSLDKFRGSNDAQSYYESQDLSDELKIYCPDPEKNKVYFYKSAFHKEDRLEIFHTLESDSGCNFSKGAEIMTSECSINKLNSKYNTIVVGNFISSYLQDGKIKINSKNVYADVMRRLSRFLQGIYLYDFFNLLIREIDEKIDKYNEPFICIYFKQVIESILKVYFGDEKLTRCAYCNRIIMKITPMKIYCSENIEGVNCRKKAQNRRYNNKEKNKK